MFDYVFDYDSPTLVFTFQIEVNYSLEVESRRERIQIEIVSQDDDYHNIHNLILDVDSGNRQHTAVHFNVAIFTNLSHPQEQCVLLPLHVSTARRDALIPIVKSHGKAHCLRQKTEKSLH